jgi:type II secretory pathway component GspD/PulD (secretin)
MDLNVLFSAIQQQDAAKLLANPRIMVLDNETASFKAIEEIPYQRLQQGGYQSFGTTEFKEVGVELEVTPHLATNGLIRLHIIPVFSVQVDSVEITTIGTGGASITSPQPVVDKREADTIAHVRDGQTVVIGGLRKQTVNQLISKVPILGDVPLLGWLFTFEGEETVNSELVVFITPKIVEEPILSEVETQFLEQTDVISPTPPTARIDAGTREVGTFKKNR